MKKTLLAISLACLLTACGSSSDDDSSSGGGAPSSSLQTGVFTDGPVANIRYETSSGLTGTTDAQGQFQYNTGDSVTFYLGDIKLGSSEAQAHVTPLDLSPDSPVRATNLLILLQSLDSDHDHSNGISISDDVLAALKGKTLDLSVDTEQFVQSPALTEVLSSENLTLVTADAAKKNFFDSFIKDNAGAWILEDKTDNSKVILYIDSETASGDNQYAFNFLLGETAAADDSGKPGIEKGQISWDPMTGKLSKVQDFEIDTNGEWGLSHPQGDFILTYGTAKDTLILKEGNETHIFKKADNTANSVVGTWVTDGLIINLASDKSFITIATETDDCAQPGIEAGTYEAGADYIQAKTMSIDTTGCSGFVDTWGSAANQYDLDKFKLTLAGNSLTVQYVDGDTGEPDAPVVFSRK